MTLQRGHVEAAQPQIGTVRELSRADLTHLTAKRAPGSLQTLKDNHHRIARCIASGLSNPEVASFCGITSNRVSILRADPSMRDLVAHYRGLLTDQWITAADPVIEFLGSIRTKSLAMIEDKIDSAAELGQFLPSRDLATFAELGLDRTGYGKVNRNVNINVDFAANLEAARKRSSRARTIEGSLSIAPQPSTPAPSPQAATQGSSLIRRRI